MNDDKNIRFKKYIKFVTTILIIIMSFAYLSMFNKVYAENEEISTSAILESQSETLRNIKFYRRGK